MCSPVTSKGRTSAAKGVGRSLPVKEARAFGFLSSTRSNLVTAALGLTVPASYLVNARGPRRVVRRPLLGRDRGPLELREFRQAR